MHGDPSQTEHGGGASIQGVFSITGCGSSTGRKLAAEVASGDVVLRQVISGTEAQLVWILLVVDRRKENTQSEEREVSRLLFPVIFARRGER
ncbi:hypothetical protein BDFG_07693 [Blastomyces dermatitidis ATCC 26199]|nr:hypothetical protein BDFG_07693 [Blastomyces dermatitidis ATCC 26199]